MPKIPVGATIAYAYRFAIGGFPRVLGIVWLPWLILAAGGFFLRSSTTAFSTAIATRDFEGISHLLIVLVPFYILTVILLFMQIAGITQQALGVRTGSPYYYFSLDKPVWRLLGAFLLATLIALGSYILLLSAGMLLGVVVAILAKLINFSPATRGILGIVAAIAIIAVFCAYVYALVRMTFFLNPVVIARGGLERRHDQAQLGLLVRCLSDLRIGGGSILRLGLRRAELCLSRDNVRDDRH